MKIFSILFFLLFINQVVAAQFIPYAGSMAYSYKTSRVTPVVGIDFFAKVYNNLSAGFGVGYFSTELGTTAQQLEDLGISIDDKTSQNLSSFPAYFTMKYQYFFSDKWSAVMIGKYGIAGGSNTYFVDPNNIYKTTAVSSGIYGSEVGFIYKKLLLTITYNNLKISNHYENPIDGIYYSNHGQIEYWGFRAGYVF